MDVDLEEQIALDREQPELLRQEVGRIGEVARSVAADRLSDRPKRPVGGQDT